jgi:Putative peptidoglycan binding domain
MPIEWDRDPKVIKDKLATAYGGHWFRPSDVKYNNTGLTLKIAPSRKLKLRAKWEELARSLSPDSVDYGKPVLTVEAARLYKLAADQGVAATCGQDVTRIQEALTKLGFYAAPIDGLFGSATLEAVRRFQVAASLPPTGTVDSATVEKLGVRCEASVEE